MVALHDIDQLLQKIRGFLKIKTIRVGLIILTAIFLCLGAFECWLNFKVRQDLRDSLGWGSGSQVKIKAHLNWLSLVDVLKGRVGWVRIDAQNCLISNLRFAELHLVNEGFTFNLPLLFEKHQLELIHLSKTRIQTLIRASDFSDYVNLFYPQFKPRIKIIPGTVAFSGEARIFGKTVPMELTGFMKILPPKKLRFYPTHLMISGHSASANFLKLVGTRLPLEFELMSEWPLALTSIDLKNSLVVLNLKEMNTMN